MPNLCDKESYDCNDLIKIVGILRSPEGCPWVGSRIITPSAIFLGGGV